jgi:GrpB-like predicted nucleotidyltransferase (UPF0157 family)
MIGLKQGVVKLRPYDECWKSYALKAMAELKAIFGSEALGIQHVGSTSVHGLIAKPIIDIAVGVEDLSVVAGFIPGLEEAGFIHNPANDNACQVFFSCGDFKADIRTHHIHVVVFNGSEWNNYLKFRDALNADAQKRSEYRALKMKLADEYPNDRDAYTEGKADFIQRVHTGS